jgi:hypothetical protein
MGSMNVNTTVDISEPLLRRARTLAVATGRTLGEVVEDALLIAFDRAERVDASPPLPVARPSTLVEGADLTFEIREVLTKISNELKVSLEINRKYIDRTISYGSYTNYLAICIALVLAFFSTILLTLATHPSSISIYTSSFMVSFQ